MASPPNLRPPNARVAYVDEAGGEVFATFYDPGLDRYSAYSKARGLPFVPHLVYQCGEPL